MTSGSSRLAANKKYTTNGRATSVTIIIVSMFLTMLSITNFLIPPDNNVEKIPNIDIIAIQEIYE